MVLATVALLWLSNHATYEVWGGALVAFVLFGITAPILYGVVEAKDGARLARLVVLALAAKLAASLIRYLVAFDVYGGVADASGYAGWGQELAGTLRVGEFDVEFGRTLIGTGFLRYISGLVFVLTGPTTLGTFFVFSWLGFLGLYGCYRAVAISCHDVNLRRYAWLVFLLPSLLFWPSSLGKEAWMLFTLGIATVGAARILTRKSRGYPLLAIGLLGAGMVRPHIALLVCLALAVAYLRRERPVWARVFGPVPQFIGLVAVAVFAVVALNYTKAYFNVAEESTVASSADEILELAANRTETGGSEFEAEPVTSPADVPRAVATVLFRPFVFEAHNLPSLLAAIETTGLLALALWSAPRWRTSLRLIFTSPYIRFAAVYTILFIVAFGAIGNFGILARQRVQMLPFFLIFLALKPPVVERLRPSVWAASR